jgi:hypothetical protein
MFVGVALAFAFVMLASLAATLARLIISEAAHTRARRVLLMVVTTLAAVALPRTISGARVLHFSDLAESLRSTGPGRVLLAPFEVFSNAMVAERWFPDLLGWAAAGATIDLALLALVLRLDVDYLEWFTAISQWTYELQQPTRRSGGRPVIFGRGASRYRIPQFPWLGGVGPIASRQLVHAVRTCRGMIVTSLVFTVMILIFNWYVSARSSAAASSPAVALGLLSYFTYIFGMGIPVAFRGDLDRLDFLKSLPMNSLAMAAGELAGAAIVLATFQLAVLTLCCAATATGGWLLLTTAVLALPVDLMFLAASNLVFLIYPVRVSAQATTDLNTLGRGFLSFLLQTIMLIPLLGVPGGLAIAVYLGSGLALPIAAITAFLALLVELPPMLLLPAGALERFDPATETPA